MTDREWQRARDALPARALVAGVDEVGRGPLVGDVVAAAVILGPARPPGLTDSKKLPAHRRAVLRELIERDARAVAIGRASAREIDDLNILQATLLAMQRAVAGLSLTPSLVLVDGNRLPRWEHRAVAVVRGDLAVPEISAASIIAKECRDAEMCALDARFPGYGFAAHKGYPTRQHLEALARLGPTPEHRRSFRPVREWLSAEETHDRTR